MKRDRFRDPYGEAWRVTEDEHAALAELAIVARERGARRADVTVGDRASLTHYLLVLRLPILPWWMGIVIKRSGGERGWETSALILRPVDLWRHRTERKRALDGVVQR